MARPLSDPAEFGRALREARQVHGISQEQLGERVGVSQGSVSSWEKGKDLPKDAARVFEIEEAVGVAPGSLSRYLGFVPASTTMLNMDVEAAIMADEALPDEAKPILLGAYRAGKTQPPKAGRPRKV